MALVVVLTLILAYRSFFAKESKEESTGNGHNLDAAQLEKTLQKILENQSSEAKTPRASTAHEDLAMDVDLAEMERDEPPAAKASGTATASAAEMAGESAAEVSQLRLSLNESHKKIEALQNQLKESQASAAAASSAAKAPAGESGGMSSAEKDELSGKVRDLEARLAEYEIISEDIADLSRYREENDQLRKELNSLKAGGAIPVAEAPAPAAPKAAAAPAAESVPESIEVKSAPAPAEETINVTSAKTAEEPTPAVTVSGGGETAAEPSSDLIDDELMKEFAAAVEGQKALDKAGEKAGAGKEAAKKTNDEDKLMNEFENFVTKKG